jgi:KaiC/GvpD/RAD55 family RecA-like ATPase
MTTASDRTFENLHDLRNEAALLHQAITDFNAYRELGIEPRDYFSGFHERLAGIVEAGYEEFGQDPDVQFGRVMAWAREKRLINGDEWDYCFRELMDPPLGIAPDARKLKQQRQYRDHREACLRAAKRFEEGFPDQAMELLRETHQQADARAEVGSRTRSIRQLLSTWEENARKGDEEGFSLGLKRLTHYVGKLAPGSVLIVGADTNVGKSTFVSECMFAAADQGTPWGYISMEDTEDTFATRWIAGFEGISAKALRESGRLKLERSLEGRRKLDSYEGRIQHAVRQNGTDQDVAAEMTVMARRGAKVIAVDYIGVVTSSIPQDRRNELRVVLMRLKAHAIRLGVALVVISQLSRPKDKGGDGYEPGKHDLKEAGDLENAADFVVLLWRGKEHDFAPVNLKLAKSKNGGVGNKWFMQREMYVEDAYGNRRPGSTRLREAVKDRTPPWAHEFPLLHESDYEAILATLQR